MKAKREQIDGELMVIKLFAINYARDLIYRVRKYAKAIIYVFFKINYNFYYINDLKPCKFDIISFISIRL